MSESTELRAAAEAVTTLRTSDHEALLAERGRLTQSLARIQLVAEGAGVDQCDSLSVAESAVWNLRAERDGLRERVAELTAEWAVMARACGNWREWPEQATEDYDHPDWKAAARAIVERDNLRLFKTWVHSYLDEHGVPHHPPGTHGEHGCRIVDRMDWLLWRG